METQKIMNLLNGSDNENSKKKKTTTKKQQKNGISLIVNQKIIIHMNIQ